MTILIQVVVRKGKYPNVHFRWTNFKLRPALRSFVFVQIRVSHSVYKYRKGLVHAVGTWVLQTITYKRIYLRHSLYRNLPNTLIEILNYCTYTNAYAPKCAYLLNRLYEAHEETIISISYSSKCE